MFHQSAVNLLFMKEIFKAGPIAQLSSMTWSAQRKMIQNKHLNRVMARKTSEKLHVQNVAQFPAWQRKFTFWAFSSRFATQVFPAKFRGWGSFLLKLSCLLPSHNKQFTESSEICTRRSEYITKLSSGRHRDNQTHALKDMTFYHHFLWRMTV